MKCGSSDRQLMDINITAQGCGCMFKKYQCNIIFKVMNLQRYGSKLSYK